MSDIRYYTPAHGQSPEDAYKLPAQWCDDPSDAAEEAADDYHRNHDGWECTWPVLFVIVMPDGSEHRFSVQRDVEPVFTASKVKES